jgi:5-methylcytosine-specific restriction enzyme subunit McrC
MHTLRAITVEEHCFIAVTEGNQLTDLVLHGYSGPVITEADANILDGLAERRPGFSQRVAGGVKLAQYCGIVRLHSCIVEVLPKIGIGENPTAEHLARSRGALLTMLHSARELPIATLEGVPQRPVEAVLIEVFIEAFLWCALEVARRGLLSRYVKHSDELPVIKGRFDIHSQVRHNLVRPHLLRCDYEEFTEDNAYNKAIAATIRACRPWIRRASTLRLWSETHSRYAGIGRSHITSRHVSRLPRERTTHHYEPVLTWCEWLLDFVSPSMSAGLLEAPTLLFDMNKLFESHVGLLEERSDDESRIIIRQGPVRSLATNGTLAVFGLKPDITIWQVLEPGKPAVIEQVVDARWKHLDPRADDWGIAASDIYQVLAYSVRYQCQRIRLVYPCPDGMTAGSLGPVFRISAGESVGFRVVEIKIDLIPLVA